MTPNEANGKYYCDKGHVWSVKSFDDWHITLYCKELDKTKEVEEWEFQQMECAVNG